MELQWVLHTNGQLSRQGLGIFTNIWKSNIALAKYIKTVSSHFQPIYSIKWALCFL